MESIQISMLKENRRIVAFDTLRYILALCVLFGHSYLYLYRNGPTLVGMQNIAVLKIYGVF